ncbi:MAG: oxygen-independent coproporphyrinogen III oxidase [Azospirillaceae bacterium]
MTPETLLKYEARRLPRYTSYPTAPHFGTAVGPRTYATWLSELPEDASLSVYLHVPYCREICWYCGCHTKATRQYAPVAKAVRGLTAEIDAIAERVPGRGRVTHVHWGGGTPNIVSPADFRAVSDRLSARLGLAEEAEIAVEIDPRVFTREHAEAYARVGVGRASLGVQSFDPTVQKAINRIQTVETTARAVGLLRRAGIRRLNMDLLYGLPHQTVDSATDTARRAVDFLPDRVAVFGYAHLPSFKRHQSRINEADLADGLGRYHQAEAIAEVLEQAGYVRIGLDHFARRDDALAIAAAAGTLRRNFQGYTVDPADALLGLGPSAIGALPQGYVQNVLPIHQWLEYLDSGSPATARGLAIGPEDRLRRAVIERLMCDLRVDLDAVAASHGAEPTFDGALAALEPLEADGLVRRRGGLIEVPEDARPLVRAVAACFDERLASSAARHARAV